MTPFTWIKSLFAKPLPDLARQSPNCQAIHNARIIKAAAVNRSLLAGLPGDDQARISAKFARVEEVLRARGSA